MDCRHCSPYLLCVKSVHLHVEHGVQEEGIQKIRSHRTRFKFEMDTQIVILKNYVALTIFFKNIVSFFI